MHAIPNLSFQKKVVLDDPIELLWFGFRGDAFPVFLFLESVHTTHGDDVPPCKETLEVF